MILAPPSWKFTSGNKATAEMFGAKDMAELISLGVPVMYLPNGSQMGSSPSIRPGR